MALLVLWKNVTPVLARICGAFGYMLRAVNLAMRASCLGWGVALQGSLQGPSGSVIPAAGQDVEARYDDTFGHKQADAIKMRTGAT